MAQASEERGSSAGDEIDMTKSMELARQGQRGDAQAVNELLTRYIPRMRRVIFIKMGAWLRARVDPDDVLQETLIVATRRLPQLEVRTPASIYQWMAKIADYEIKNRIEYERAEKRDPDRERHLRTDDLDSSDSGVVVPFKGPSASQFLVRDELERQIDECVEALDPPDYREVIMMVDYYEADWESIRVKLGRPNVAAVQDLYARAQKRLRERLARDHG